MKLKSFGCSFIWGSELCDTLDLPHRPSALTWPALLSKYLDLDYQCCAKPGCGNLSIADQILNHLTQDQPDLYVINWTWIDRFDYIQAENNSWQTVRPGNKNDSNTEFYYRNFHSELKDKIQTIQLIKFVISELELMKKNYIMTYMDQLILDQRWHTTPAMIAQQNFIRSRLQHWPKSNWCEYAVQQGHAITSNGHLLETGHRFIFDEVVKRLDYILTK